jgi:hypothetical protein
MKRGQKSCIYGIGYHLAMYGCEKNFLSSNLKTKGKNDCTDRRKEATKTRTPQIPDPNPPIKTPIPYCSISERQNISNERIVAVERRRKHSAIGQLVDRLRLILLNPLLHSSPDAFPIRPRYTLLLFKVLKHQRIASLTADNPVRPSKKSDQVLRVFVVFADETNQSTAFVDHTAEYRLMSGSSCFCVTVTRLEESYHVQGQDCGVGVCAFGIRKGLIETFDCACL